METRRLAAQTLANALGTLIAAAVIYLVGVLAGVFTFELLATILSTTLAAAAGALGYRLARKAKADLDRLTADLERANAASERAQAEFEPLDGRHGARVLRV